MIIIHLESEGILTDAQHSFHAKRSCETQQLVSTMHDLTQRFEKGETSQCRNFDVVILILMS